MASDRPHEILARGLAALLPEAIARTLESYRRYALGDPPVAEDAPLDPKAFAAHHAACRAALAHLDALAKLVRLAAEETAGAGDLDALVAEARCTLDPAVLRDGAEGDSLIGGEDEEDENGEDGAA